MKAPFIAAKTDYKGSIHGVSKHWKLFKLENNKYQHVLPDHSVIYLDQKDIDWAKKFCNALLKEFNTEKDARFYIKEQIFKLEHGPRNKKNKDFSCPNCGYDFEAPDILDEEYHTQREKEDLTMYCLCGKKFTVHLTYTVNIDAKIK